MLRHGQKVIEMTELGDVYSDYLYINDIVFTGSGLTAGEFLTLVDGDGKQVAQHRVIAATENEPLINNPTSFRGLKVSQIPNGSVSIMVRIR
jgi:hypothetical protein